MIPVKPHIAENAHIKSLAEYKEMYRRSVEEPADFWREMAGIVDWFAPPRNIMDVDMEEVDFSWFGGGRLNACYNCVDRHLPYRGEQTAIIWAADEPGSTATSPTASSSTTWRASPTFCSTTACGRATASASTCR